MSNFKKNWRGFLGAIFDPWVLVLFSLTSGMLALSYLFAQSFASNSNELIFPIFSFWIAISAGILGSKIAKGLSDTKQWQDLIARGCTSLRDLKLLFTNLVSLENRIMSCLGQRNGPTSESLRVYCEEIIEKFTMLKEEVINSIEEWADVIPDAKLKSHIEVFNDLKLALHFSRIEFENLNQQITATNVHSKKDLQELFSRLKEQKKEIHQLREKVLETKRNLDKTILSGISTSVLTSSIVSPDIFPELKAMPTFSSLHCKDEQTSLNLSLADMLDENNLTEISSKGNGK